jgi:hypothetical protein
MGWRKRKQPTEEVVAERPLTVEELADLCSKPRWWAEATDRQLVDIIGYEREIDAVLQERRTTITVTGLIDASTGERLTAQGLKWDSIVSDAKYRWEARTWKQGPWHLDDIPFFDAPKPPKNHKCWAQTWGVNSSGSELERCPCGGMRIHLTQWMDRNTRPDRNTLT